MAASGESGARGLRTPMGLGWSRHLGLAPGSTVARCSRWIDEGHLRDELEVVTSALPDGDALVVVGIHDLRADLIALTAELTREALGRRPVVLCSAAALPPPLRELVDRQDVTAPVDLEEFSAAHPGSDRALDGWAECGGWPEAGIWDVTSGWCPSDALAHFAADTAEKDPGLARIVLLCAVADRGLPPEVLVSVTGAGLEEVIAVAERGELLGLLRWAGAMLRPTVPLLAPALSLNESSLRIAAAALATDPAARERGLSAVPAVRTGLDLDEELRHSALRSLEHAEGSLDTHRWRLLANAYRGHGDPEIRRAGEDALLRLLITRGAEDPAPQDPAALGPAPQDLSPAVELFRRVMNFDGVSLTGSTSASLDPSAALPLSGSGSGYASVVIQGTIAAMRGQDDLADACMDELLREPNPSLGPAWHIAFLKGDWATIDRIEIDHPESPYLAVSGTIRDAAEGRFTSAARKFTALVGDDWAQAAPLFQHMALYIASGIDVELTRRLLRNARAPRPARIGTLAASFLRARAELVTGDPERARARVLQVWDAAISNGFTRPLRMVGSEVLLIVAEGGDLTSLGGSDPGDGVEPILELAHLLEEEKLDVESTREVAGALPLLYQRTHVDLLLGRRAVDLGDRQLAEELLVGAEATYAALGAPVDAARTRRLLRRIDPALDRGRHREFSERSRPDGVTGREQEVLELVARGLTNKQIAATLHLSVATVKRHVTSLLRSFDADSRRELIGVLTDSSSR